jgi:hypothetical protein
MSEDQFENRAGLTNGELPAGATFLPWRVLDSVRALGVIEASVDASPEWMSPTLFSGESPRGLNRIDAHALQNRLNREPSVFVAGKLHQLLVVVKIEVLVNQHDSKTVYGVILKEHFSKLTEYS